MSLIGGTSPTRSLRTLTSSTLTIHDLDLIDVHTRSPMPLGGSRESSPLSPPRFGSDEDEQPLPSSSRMNHREDLVPPRQETELPSNQGAEVGGGRITRSKGKKKAVGTR